MEAQSRALFVFEEKVSQQQRSIEDSLQSFSSEIEMHKKELRDRENELEVINYISVFCSLSFWNTDNKVMPNPSLIPLAYGWLEAKARLVCRLSFGSFILCHNSISYREISYAPFFRLNRSWILPSFERIIHLCCQVHRIVLVCVCVCECVFQHN